MDQALCPPPPPGTWVGGWVGGWVSQNPGKANSAPPPPPSVSLSSPLAPAQNFTHSLTQPYQLGSCHCVATRHLQTRSHYIPEHRKHYVPPVAATHTDKGHIRTYSCIQQVVWLSNGSWPFDRNARHIANNLPCESVGHFCHTRARVAGRAAFLRGQTNQQPQSLPPLRGDHRLPIPGLTTLHS